MSVVQHPPVLWAQRKDKLFVTINVQDCSNPKLKLDKTNGSDVPQLRFTGKIGDGTPVEVELSLHGEVDQDQARVSVTGRHVVVVIPKKTEGFWPRLTKDKQPRFVSVDWGKWVDEDEEAEQPEFDMSQFGALDQYDSDDDEEEPNEEDPKLDEVLKGGEI